MTEPRIALVGPIPNDAPEDVARAKRSTQRWGGTLVVMALVLVVSVIYLLNATVRQDDRISSLGQVVDRQNTLYGQVCRIAGGQVNADPAAQEACARVERGEQAVPDSIVMTGATGAPGATGNTGPQGVGVRYTKQIDRCYIEVGLTNGAVNNFGPFCGEDGEIGPTGKPGKTGTPGTPGVSGSPGVPGAPGVGIADVRANGCLVDVVLSDATTRTVGPFCGPPVAEYTVAHEDGSTERCTRSGGTDTAPNYACVVAAAPTGTTETTPTPTS